MSQYTIEMVNITKKFGNILANDKVCLQLKKGEIHALLGENGAGKSTLMSILFGMYQPDEGYIKKDGSIVEINSPNDATALQIGMVHQHFKLVGIFSVLDNIILGAEPKSLGFVKRQQARKEIEQISENARKEREMYERQAALDREAENERAKMMAEAEIERAEAERERTAAIERQTSSMARQASLDRAAAERRAEWATSSASSTPHMKRSYTPALDKDKEYVSGVGYRDTFGNYYDHNGKPIPAPISIKDKK